MVMLDLMKIENGTLTEEKWNVTFMKHQPYSYSKVMAEALLEELKKQDRWDLVVINPPVVLGPSLSENNTSGSLDLMWPLAMDPSNQGSTDSDRYG